MNAITCSGCEYTAQTTKDAMDHAAYTGHELSAILAMKVQR